MLCHKNPNQINDLTNELIKNGSDVYIHIDLKSNIESKINTNDHIFILPKEKSYSVSWGGNDMIKATLSLIKYVKDTNINYDYIWLISGQDFPIVSSDIITKRLTKDNGFNFIEIIDKNSNKYNRYNKLYTIWYPKWITKNSAIIKIIKRLYMIVTGGFGHTFKLFLRKKPFDFDFYFGSQWWCLTSQCAFDLLKYSEENINYINYFDNVIIPDECFFQTLFMNSKYKSKQKDYLTFVNWKEDRRSPETLTINDLELLMNQSDKKCFARKFDYNVDKDIVDSLLNRR